MAFAIQIVSYEDSVHRDQVIAIWSRVFGYQTAHNEPSLAIDRKCAVGDDMIYVAMLEETVIGTILAGYDGHRAGFIRWRCCRSTGVTGSARPWCDTRRRRWRAATA